VKIYTLVFNPIEVNTYIIADPSGDCIIIDCGCYYGHEFDEMDSFIQDNKLKPVLLLNTHCHLDHIFGNGWMLERFGIRSHYCREDDYNRIDAPVHARLFGLNMELPPEPADYLEDGQIVSHGQIRLTALHVPGHSSGSLSFYSSDLKAVFTGDALFAGSIGRTDLEGGNFETLIASIRNKLSSLPDDTIVYPGHGECTTIKVEKETNPYFIKS